MNDDLKPVVIPTDASQFVHLHEDDFISSSGNLRTEHYLAGNVLLLRMMGSILSEDDFESHDVLLNVLKKHFTPNDLVYGIIDATAMKTVALEQRRSFFYDLKDVKLTQKVIIFGLNEALTALVLLGAYYTQAQEWLAISKDLDSALELLQEHANKQPKTRIKKIKLTDHEKMVLTALSRMVIENKFDQTLPQLNPDDPFANLFTGIAALQNDFKLMQETYDRQRDELNKANIDLNQQVKQQSELLLKSEENYRLVVETATDGILIVTDGIIRYANPHALRMLRYPADEVIGQSVSRFTNPGARVALQESGGQKLAGSSIPTRYESSIFPQYGKPLVVEIRATEMQYEGQASILAFVRDITQRKTLEEAERTARELAETLRDIGEVLGSTLELNEVLDRMVNLAKRMIPYDSVVVQIFKADGTPRPKRYYQFDLAKGGFQVSNSISNDMLEDKHIVQSLMLTKQPYIINNFEQHPGWNADGQVDPKGSWMGIPVLLRGEVNAIISFYTSKRNFYTRTHAKNAQLFSHQVSLAMDNAMLYDDAKKRISELSILNQIGQASSKSVASDELLALVYQLIKETFKIKDFCARRFIHENQEFETLFLVENGVVQKNIRHGVDNGLFKMIIESRKPLLLENHDEYQTLNIEKHLGGCEEPLTSWMGAPLIIANEVYGLMATKSTDPAQLFDNDDLSLFTIIAQHLSIAIENANLDEQMQRHQEYLVQTVAERTAELEKVLATLEQRVASRTEELTALFTVSSLISRMTHLPSTLQQALQVILPLLKADAAAIHLINPEENIRFLYSPHSLPQGFVSAIDAVPRMESVRADIINGGTILINDLTVELKNKYVGTSQLEEHGLKGFIGLPIHGQKKMVGVLSLYKTGAKSFNHDDAGLLSAVTDQLGIAIENDQLRSANERNAVVQERQRLARDLHDSVSQLLYSQVLYSNAVKKGLSEGSAADVSPYLNQMEETARQALREMRLMIFELRSNILAEEGLASAIRNRIETVEQRSGLIARLNYNAPEHLPPDIENEFYYIVVEALNNVLKHSNARTVHINIGRENDLIILEVADDGRGFDPVVVKKGMGLVSMQERVSRINGTLEIQSDAENGTRVVVRVKPPKEKND